MIPSNMKTLGLIGGLGPETTVEYYRLIIARYLEKTGGEYPSIIINSVDLNRLINWMNGDELGKAADYLSAEIERLYNSGANLAALATNTPHIVFDELRRRAKLPLISIVEATCKTAQSLGCSKVALLGTRFTMQARFYPDVFEKAGIELITPTPEEQSYIHDKYMNELLKNAFLPETRTKILDIIEALISRESVEAVILGGTELPLLLRTEEHNGVALLDTARIHSQALVDALLSDIPLSDML
jgi:aspartate racemase